MKNSKNAGKGDAADANEEQAAGTPTPTTAVKPMKRDISKAERIAIAEKKKKEAKEKAEAKEKEKVEREAKKEAKAAEKAEKAKMPKAPQSAFFLFCTDVRQKISEENPEATMGERSKLIGAAWKEVRARRDAGGPCHQEPSMSCSPATTLRPPSRERPSSPLTASH